MLNVDELLIELHDRPIAALKPDGNDGYQLEFLPNTVREFDGRFILSVSLPVRSEPYEAARAKVFLEGLLPEGRVRERLCRRLRLDQDDTIGLLRSIGRDCAGAISVVPTLEAHVGQAESDVEWLTEKELALLIVELPTRPLGASPDEGIRLSLAGAQDKVPVVIDGQRIGLPRGSTPSTHILKPSNAETSGSGHLLYPSLVENEAFCLRLAANCGLEAATAEVQEHGVRVLVVRRYDRYQATGGTRRIHQEDICQALGVPPRLKYEEDGGPGVAKVIELLREISAASAADMLTFLRRLVFTHLIGNLDAHAKNTSLLYSPDGLRLAPLYDSPSTIVYPQLSKRLAMRIGTQSQADQVTPRHWLQLLESCEMNSAGTRRELAMFAERVLDAFAPTRSEARDQGINHPILDEIEEYAIRRAPSVRELSNHARRHDARPAKK